MNVVWVKTTTRALVQLLACLLKDVVSWTGSIGYGWVQCHTHTGILTIIDKGSCMPPCVSATSLNTTRSANTNTQNSHQSSFHTEHDNDALHIVCCIRSTACFKEVTLCMHSARQPLVMHRIVTNWKIMHIRCLEQCAMMEKWPAQLARSQPNSVTKGLQDCRQWTEKTTPHGVVKAPVTIAIDHKMYKPKINKWLEHKTVLSVPIWQ